MSESRLLDRRRFLQLGGLAAGALATRGLDGLIVAETAGWDFRRTARSLVESLSPLQRRHVMLPWDHPSRGLVTHVACMRHAPRVADVLGAGQRRLVQRLYDTMTSAPERRRLGRLVGLEAGGLDPCALLIYGNPDHGDFQVMISGAHLLIRGGGMTRAGSAFGGPLAYGHQLGNGVPRLPGNAFADHGDALNAFLATLPETAQREARVRGRAHHETAVQLQGPHGRFRGLAASRLGERGRERLAGLVDLMLSCYDTTDREAAWGCIRRNGGVEALRLAVWTDGGRYDDGRAMTDLPPDERARRGVPYWHVWRIEGPGSVLHFRGWPHVHAAIHLADDGGARQHVGSSLGRTPRLLEDRELRPLLEEALRQATGLPVAFHADAIPARFVPGPITTGLVWNLDPFDAEVGVLTIRGAAMAEPLREALRAQGGALDPASSYRIALPSLFAADPLRFGEPEAVEGTGLRTRGVYEAYFRKGLALLS